MSKAKLMAALDVAGRACTEATVAEIELLLRQAKDASKVMFRDVTVKDVVDIQRTDTLVRLQRNALALQTLLDQARDTAIYMRQEIGMILTAEADNDEAKKARQKAALERELKKIYNDKQRKSGEEE